MCLLITVALAIVFSVLFFVSKRNNGTENSKSSGKKNFSQPLFTTMLSFWAAAIMWSVDGIASVFSGEPFFDLSKEDAILGGIVALCGLMIFIKSICFKK